MPRPILDSAGIYFTTSGRHFDRGSGEPAAGRYLREEEVAGASGAAGFYRRTALEQAQISTGYFDADFFLYREDADLAWRLSRLGWKCLYVPAAVAAHRRRNLPERRRAMPAVVNLHSVKNRFLLRINNQTARRGPQDARSDARAGSRRPRGVPDRRADVAAGLRLALEEPRTSLGQATRDLREGRRTARLN